MTPQPVVTMVFAGGLGVVLEFGQLLSPSRDFEIADMVADAAGVCVGIAIGWPLRQRVARSLRSV